MKKISAAILVLALFASTTITSNALLVAMSVSPLSATNVDEGGSISFDLDYSGDIQSIELTREDIHFVGFDASCYIKDEGNKRTVLVENLYSTSPDAEKRITISEGTAVSSDGMLANAGHTQTFTINEKPRSGKCGKNAYWSLDYDGTLTISGKGKIWDRDVIDGDRDGWVITEHNYSDFGFPSYFGYATDLTAEEIAINEENPWLNYKQRNTVKKVIVKSGIKEIGKNFLASYGMAYVYPNLQEVIIENGVTEIGQRFIASNPCFKVTIPSSVKKINTAYKMYYETPFFKIYGKTGSYAETYAKEQGILFVDSENGLPVTKAEFPVIINGQQIDSSVMYPLIVYNDITYFPLTYQNCLFAGIQSEWTQSENAFESTLSLTYTGNPAEYAPERGQCKALKAFPALFNVFINNQQLYSVEYPVLICNDVTYIPLTWDVATSFFGWSINYANSENGGLLTISTTEN